MPNLKDYRIFISHCWNYNSDYYNLEEKLESYPYLAIKNYSVPQHDRLDTNTNSELYEALKRQISPVNVVIVIAGMYVNYREWIQKEIEIAKLYKKPIIAVRPRGAEKMPQDLINVSDVVVNWNIDSIVGAIRNYSI